MAGQRSRPTALPLAVQPRSADALKPLTSPCFVHSHLDNVFSVLDAKQSLSAQLRVAKSLQSSEPDDEYRSITKQLAETAVTVREMSKQLGRARIHSNIQTVLIVTKARDNRLIKLTRQLALYLMLRPRDNHKRGLIVYVDNQLRHSRRFDAVGIQRDHPELFVPVIDRRNSGSDSSASSESNVDLKDNKDGQLRYWTSAMCSNAPHLFDFVVTLGGDGTVLFTSWLFQRIVPPVLSFALGSLGFLTNFDFNDYQLVMDAAIDTGIRVNLRMRFTCTVYRSVVSEVGKKRRAVKKGDTGEILMKNVEKDGWEALECDTSSHLSAGAKDKEIMCYSTRPAETFEVLNDLVIDRGPSPYVSLLELFGDEHHMTTVQADGLTIATPTGSTAYSLSAGGSLVHPEIPAILITPLCPHTLSFRPMLLPDTMEVRVCVPYNSRSTAWASFDGRGRVELGQGDHIKITASMYPFPTVCADKQSTDWFHAITRTLKWNERERQKSFVVVEEENRMFRRRGDTSASDKAKSSARGLSDGGEEEDEVSDEEEAFFDIDDSSGGEVQATASAGIQTSESALGQEKTAERLGLSRPERQAILRPRHAARSRSRSRPARRRSRSPNSSSEQSGVETPGRYAGPQHFPPFRSHHVNFELPDSPDFTFDLVDEADGNKQPGKPQDREAEHDSTRTPTVMCQTYHKSPKEGRPRSSDYGARAFAVWGQDESDSATSDNSDNSDS